MKNITQDLPQGRVIIDGLGYAEDVQSIKSIWNGLLAYHAYPFWLPSDRTQSNYSNHVQSALAGVAHRTFVTEFGADLSRHGNFDDSSEIDENVQFLKGLDDVFNVLKPRATFVWHGYNNGDSYGYWSAKPSARAKVDSTQRY